MNPQPPEVSSIIALIVWFGVFESIIRGFLAIESSEPLEDERDKLIEQISNGYSYGLVCVCLCVCLGRGHEFRSADLLPATRSLG